MASTLTIGGIGEWLELPRELRAAADPVIKRHAEASRDRVKASYKVVTGRLRDGVIMKATPSSDPAITTYTVASTADHAAPYEWGSQTFGTRAHHTFLTITNADRRACNQAVIAIVKAAGFTVTGDDT